MWVRSRLVPPNYTMPWRLFLLRRGSFFVAAAPNLVLLERFHRLAPFLARVADVPIIRTVMLSVAQLAALETPVPLQLIVGRKLLLQPFCCQNPLAPSIF